MVVRSAAASDVYKVQRAGVGKFLKKMSGEDRIENGISQELGPFVVYSLTVGKSE